METWKLAFFLVASLGLVLVSRRSLFRPRSHGFFRFFAWEALLVLFLWNASDWFRDWRAWHQLISWLLLVGCLVPLWLGVNALRRRGRPDPGGRAEPALLAFERTTQLVTSGIYSYIRHPLYSSLLLLGWGIFFKRPSWTGLILAVVANLLLFATARRDEAECAEVFGPAYRQYMLRSRMFIPYLF